jgi:hypothetical protein
MDNVDKRRSPRHRVLKDGKIVMLNNWSVVDCCVRDVSETGARISCQDPAAVPNEFRLLIPHDKLIRDVRVMWRRGDTCGVQFTSVAKIPPPRKW